MQFDRLFSGSPLRARALAVAAVAAAIAPLAASALAASSGSVKTARQATDKYHSAAVAKKAGHARLKDEKGIACIDKPGEGAMGIHYVKSSLVGDPAIDLRHPEALVYEPTRGGKLRLVALEWVVLQADWDASHSSPPRLFGQEFMLQASPNRFGLPAFYALHAWVWKANHHGMFMPWNPAVTCKYAAGK
jgi:hypothetical protein